VRAIVVFFLTPLLAPAVTAAPANPAKEATVMVMKMTSAAFKHEAAIPARFTCDGTNASPPISWSDLPSGTKSLVLVVTDPDAPDPKAPKTTWVHWVLYDIPASASDLREAVPSKGLPPGTLEGTNDWGRTGYGGPCPPIGRHRYVHTLYALDTVLNDLDRPTRAKLLAAMQGHVLQTAELIGTYQRP
jgi:Raf kinase inhibitor-like YbhB/YbcL family protein